MADESGVGAGGAGPAVDRSHVVRVEDLLDLGRARLRLEVAILARVQAERYTVVAMRAPAEIRIAPGTSLELQRTCCADVIRCADLVAFERVRGTTRAMHTAFRNFRVESYVGCPVVVAGGLWGTFSLSSPTMLPRRFSDHDLVEVRLLAQALGRMVEQRRVRLPRAA